MWLGLGKRSRDRMLRHAVNVLSLTHLFGRKKKPLEAFSFRCSVVYAASKQAVFMVCCSAGYLCLRVFFVGEWGNALPIITDSNYRFVFPHRQL